ncbi:MAG: glycosyltransferase [candidate division Zixibacteria bacterium]|nr:glycosyltransferase [candidate division Zixibacteria bacterium]
MPGKRIVIFGWSNSVHIQRWVSGLKGRGYVVKVISLDGRAIPEVETVVLPRRGRWSYLTQARRAAEAAHLFQPDLVHVHYASGFGVWGLKTGIEPTVVSVWGSDLLEFPSNAVNRFIVRRVLNRATHITATSRLLAVRAGQLAPAAKDKISIIPFGVALPERVHPLPPGRPLRICYIKPHKPVYRPDVLVQAVAEVKKTFPDVILSMAGEGPLTGRLLEQARRLRLEDNVKMVGRLDYGQIHDFIAEHHLMVLPSRMESFGVAVLDASAAGRAVVASDVGGIPEVLKDGETGILVPAGDWRKLAQAITDLAEDAERLKRLGEAGREFVKSHFAWEKSLDLMSELYERLIYESKKT